MAFMWARDRAVDRATRLPLCARALPTSSVAAEVSFASAGGPKGVSEARFAGGRRRGEAGARSRPGTELATGGP